MPQMAIIQPASPKGPLETRTAGTAGKKEQNTFSPHLDKAVSNNKKQQPAAQDERRTKASSNVETETLPAQNSASQQPQDAEDTQDLALQTDMANQPDELDKTDENPGQLSVPGAGIEKSTPRVMNTALSQLQQAEPAMQRLQNTSAAGTGEPDLPVTIPAERTLAITEPPVKDAIQPTLAKEQNGLLAQLQRIIDQGDETGIVSITKATDPVSASFIRSNVHGAEQAGERPGQQSTGIRHDSQQQHFKPQLAASEPGDNKQNFQNDQQGDEPAQQAMGASSPSSPANGMSSSSEQSNTFTQITTTTQQTTSQQTGETAKPILLPSGTLVQEEDVMQQLNHKLQISSRHMDSRISLKLHPLELGSLKIDLTVKEGSIQAHVVAQSQHTSEILEKNMAKLKSILENQGFTVDEISVTTESDSASEFNLFDQQLFSQNDDTPKAQKGRREDEPVFILPNNVFPAPATSTGVNVKI